MVFVTALASAGCYALALVLAQLGLRGESPLAGATVSLPTTAASFLLVSVFALDLSGYDGRAAAIFAACGLLFPVSVTLLSFQGNRLLGPNLAGALGNATPLFAVAFGIVILGDHLTVRGAFGLLAILSGVALLSIRPATEARRWRVIALAVPLAAAIVRGLVQPVVKAGLALWPQPLAATVMSYVVSGLVILAISTICGGGRPRLPSRRSVPIFAAVGLLNGGSVLLLYQALSLGRVSLVAPLVAVYPLFTLALSAMFLRGEELLHPRLLVGIAATVLGVVLLLSV